MAALLDGLISFAVSLIRGCQEPIVCKGCFRIGTLRVSTEIYIRHAQRKRTHYIAILVAAETDPQDGAFEVHCTFLSSAEPYCIVAVPHTSLQ